ncbi:MAG: copper chaperone PCu(A)C [Candidatus Omnitrophica bacterium]|nr:copper chaperone PCu(A)C [Candidatus Omnitrophota bacterium]
MLKKLILSCLMGAVLIAGTNFHAQAENNHVVVSNAWVRVLPPSQKNTAAYMTIENKTDKEMILMSASADAAGEVQTHKMEHVDGMMKMEQVDGITVPAQGKVELKPHSFHLMLLNLKTPITEGDTVPIVLTFNDSSTVTVQAAAKGEAPDDEMTGHEHHHE